MSEDNKNPKLNIRVEELDDTQSAKLTEADVDTEAPSDSISEEEIASKMGNH
jgi:hypothetical protein